MATEPLARSLATWLAGLERPALGGRREADARLRLLDVAALALAASRTPLGRAVRAGAAHEPGPCHGFGASPGLSAGMAALVNGTLAHAMDFDDTHLPTLVHPSAPLWSVALALGEERDLTLADVLPAVVGGSEVACRLGLAAPGAFHHNGLHPTSVLGTPAAAMVAARLLGLDVAGTVNACGIAASQASGILESYQDGTWVKTLHAGWAAHAGLVAARLAAAGFTGPATGLEGRFGMLRALLDGPSTELDLDASRNGLGERWTSDLTYFKLYPCAHVILPFVELALAWRRAGGDPAGIRAVEVGIAERFVPVVCEPREAKAVPGTPTHARASLSWCVARALVRGELGVADFEPPALGDAGTLALARRVRHVPLELADAEGFGGRLRLVLEDGTTVDETLVSTRGHPLESATAADIVAKARGLARDLLDDDAIARWLHLTLKAEAREVRIRALMAVTGGM